MYFENKQQTKNKNKHTKRKRNKIKTRRKKIIDLVSFIENFYTQEYYVQLQKNKKIKIK